MVDRRIHEQYVTAGLLNPLEALPDRETEQTQHQIDASVQERRNAVVGNEPGRRHIAPRRGLDSPFRNIDAGKCESAGLWTRRRQPAKVVEVIALTAAGID